MSDFAVDWADLLKSTVSISTLTGTDSYGNETWSVPVSLSAHVDRTVVADATASGLEGVAGTLTLTGTLYIPVGLVAVMPGDRVTLPGGTVVELTEVITNIDADGNDHHYECRWESS